MNRMSKLTIAILWTVLATVLLAARCGPTPTPTPPGESLEWEEIAQYVSGKSDYTYEDRPRITIITNQEEATVLEGQVYPEVLDRVLDSDFSTHFIIAVFQGYQGCANYSVEVTDVRREGSVIAVYARFLTPDPEDIRQPIETSPYHVLRVKKMPTLRGDFVFVLVANDKEIVRQSHFIP